MSTPAEVAKQYFQDYGLREQMKKVSEQENRHSGCVTPATSEPSTPRSDTAPLPKTVSGTPSSSRMATPIKEVTSSGSLYKISQASTMAKESSDRNSFPPRSRTNLSSDFHSPNGSSQQSLRYQGGATSSGELELPTDECSQHPHVVFSPFDGMENDPLPTSMSVSELRPPQSRRKLSLCDSQPSSVDHVFPNPSMHPSGILPAEHSQRRTHSLDPHSSPHSIDTRPASQAPFMLQRSSGGGGNTSQKSSPRTCPSQGSQELCFDHSPPAPLIQRSELERYAREALEAVPTETERGQRGSLESSIPRRVHADPGYDHLKNGGSYSGARTSNASAEVQPLATNRSCKGVHVADTDTGGFTLSRGTRNMEAEVSAGTLRNSGGFRGAHADDGAGAACPSRNLSFLHRSREGQPWRPPDYQHSDGEFRQQRRAEESELRASNKQARHHHGQRRSEDSEFRSSYPQARHCHGQRRSEDSEFRSSYQQARLPHGQHRSEDNDFRPSYQQARQPQPHGQRRSEDSDSRSSYPQAGQTHATQQMVREDRTGRQRFSEDLSSCKPEVSTQHRPRMSEDVQGRYSMSDDLQKRYSEDCTQMCIELDKRWDASRGYHASRLSTETLLTGSSCSTQGSWDSASQSHDPSRRQPSRLSHALPHADGHHDSLDSSGGGRFSKEASDVWSRFDPCAKEGGAQAVGGGHAQERSKGGVAAPESDVTHAELPQAKPTVSFLQGPAVRALIVVVLVLALNAFLDARNGLSIGDRL
eukprot:gene5766-6065_t